MLLLCAVWLLRVFRCGHVPTTTTNLQANRILGITRNLRTKLQHNSTQKTPPNKFQTNTKQQKMHNSNFPATKRSQNFLQSTKSLPNHRPSIQKSQLQNNRKKKNPPLTPMKSHRELRRYVSGGKTQATKKYIDHPSVTLGLCPVYVAQKAYEGTGRRPWGSADITVDVRLDWRNATRSAREFISTLTFHRLLLFSRSGPLCSTCSVARSAWVPSSFRLIALGHLVYGARSSKVIPKPQSHSGVSPQLSKPMEVKKVNYISQHLCAQLLSSSRKGLWNPYSMQG